MTIDTSTENRDRRAITRAMIQTARSTWDNAPQHVKIVGGAWVRPILAALQAMDAEMDQMRAELAELKGAQHGA
jgi:hypothetical protein